MADGYDLTLSGLIRKRAQVAGEIDALRDRLSEMMADLDNLDAAIRIFKPDIDFEDLPMRRVPPPHVAFRGELARFLLEYLRKAKRPLTTKELGEAVMDARRLNVADKILFKTITARTGHSLARLRDKGHVKSERHVSGGMMSWWIASADAEIEYRWRNASSHGS